MKRLAVRTVKLLFVFAGVLSILLLFVGVRVLSQIPSEKQIRGCMTTKMYKVDLCPSATHYVKYGQISPVLVKTVVLTEDSAFWQHNGFDFGELQKSLETNLKKGRYARGGSTITQQLAKNMFLTQEKTLTRKGLEALITMRLEKFLTKKEILEKYLNIVQFGPEVFGIRRAAQFYFKKSPAELDAIESAFLAMLLPSPEKYSQSFRKKQLTKFARQRLNQILERMFEFERIDAAEYRFALDRMDTFLGGAPPPPEETVPPAEIGPLDESEEFGDPGGSADAPAEEEPAPNEDEL